MMVHVWGVFVQPCLEIQGKMFTVESTLTLKLQFILPCAQIYPGSYVQFC